MTARTTLRTTLGTVRRTAVAAALALTLAACSLGGDHTADGNGPAGAGNLAAGARPAGVNALRAPVVVPDVAPVSMRGTVVTVQIPGTAEHFAARPALVYLPPVLRRDPHRALPLVELLHGVPGKPTDWVDNADVSAVLDDFAAAHGGVAPIVVMPDINGALHADSECVTVKGADVERYLTTAVPAYVRAHYPVSPQRVAVVGNSEGGTCSLMLALRHPEVFGAFGDLSGEAHLTLGHLNNPARTLEHLYGGSIVAYDEHDPVWLLQHRTFPALAGWFACGSSDVAGVQAQSLLDGAAHAARLDVSVRTVAGRHSWSVWSAAFQQLLPWLWKRVSA